MGDLIRRLLEQRGFPGTERGWVELGEETERSIDRQREKKDWYLIGSKRENVLDGCRIGRKQQIERKNREKQLNNGEWISWNTNFCFARGM